MTEFKCPYCKVIMIKNLEKLLKESNLPYEECSICNGLIWRKKLEDELSDK
jgi:hypothetical protein